MPLAIHRKPGQAAEQADIGFDDVMPSALIDQLLKLPENSASDLPPDASGSNEPSLKRRKVDSPLAVSSVCVGRGEISFTRMCSQNATPGYTEIRQDVEKHLSISLDDGRLRIYGYSSRDRSPGLTRATVSLRPQDVSQHAANILGKFQTSQKKPGGIWTSVQLSIERQERIATVKLSLQLFWNETPSPYHPFRRKKERVGSQNLIDTFFPRPNEGRNVPAWSPMDFYEAAFVPPKEDATPLTIDIPSLDATLFPYQKRTLQWLLGREGMRWSPSHRGIEALPAEMPTPGADNFRLVQDANGHEIYLHDVFHIITSDPAPYRQVDLAVKGGILAEEMGLGKTIEILGLILLHKRSRSGELIDANGAKLLSSGATLIVTPESLRAQWMSEIARHAPSLRVKNYRGCKKLQDGEDDEIVEELANCDVVITTYNVLTAELHFANDPPERSRRYERAYRRMKSPLVQISWWRLCLDEAQMIENGYSQAASVARVLPRINAWGITGTPVKDNVKDLLGLLQFLRYQPYCYTSFLWNALISGHKDVFQALFGTIALRHTKALVRDELSLPPQKRYVVSMPFTAVEEQHYQSLFKDMTTECEFDADGAPVIEDWSPEDFEDKMRVWLNRLRQTVLHPEVGVYGRRVLGQGKAGPMKTVEEVLDAMLDQNEGTIRMELRAHLLSRLTRGQLYENSPRVREALAIWEEVKQETATLVSEARVQLKLAIQKHGSDGALSESGDDIAADLSGSDEDTEDAEIKGHVGECRRRLRTNLDLHHRATFFCANGYFQIRDNPEMTEPGSPEFDRLKKLEDAGYEEAKTIRREILRERNRRTGRLMKDISDKASSQSFTEVPELVHNPKRGIESGRIVDDLEQLYGELNNQADVLDEWRERIIQLLLRPLVDEEDEVETTGEELGDSAKYQDELAVYIQALRAIVADRQNAISGQTNELVKHETDTSLRMAKNGEGPAPEKLIELLQIREQIQPKVEMSMRGAISHLRPLTQLLSGNRENLENKIASDQLKTIQAALADQNKAALALESEIENFSAVMNARLEYYRQLQAVSDGVLPYEGARTEAAIERMRKGEDESRRKLSSAEAKHRYLLNLKEAGSKSKEPRMCVICQMPFVTGVLTVCGHQFCKECMMMWFKSHHNCPVCKKALKSSNLHDITFNPKQLQVHSEGPSRTAQDQLQTPQQGHNGALKKAMIYSEFSSEKLIEITSMELDGPSFTTKVDTLVRHILWLRESDPGAKSIVFSQYRDFFKVLRNAFRRFRIGFASIDEANGTTKFKDDPAVECFLLHARAHSSGLNLVNASHVFLCEPLLNTALELQAIARVDRIGQQHETTVWLYYVSGTVEESIHNLSVRRRMEHMGRSLKGKSKESTPELLDANIEAANTLELEHAALSKLMSRDKTAGEMVDKGDLWECLFGHVANRQPQPERDSRFQEQAVMNYMAGEAAEERRDGMGEE